MVISTTTSQTITTSFLLSNLHCPSCISNIENALSILQPQPISISTSIVTSWATVCHLTALPATAIQDALEDAGFGIRSIIEDGVARDIISTPTQRRMIYNPLDEYFDSPREEWKTQKRPGEAHTRSNPKHLQHCDLCQAETVQSLMEKESSQDSYYKADSKEYDSTPSEDNGKKSDPRLGVDQQEVPLSGITIDVAPESDEDRWEASLAISGMTCASCAKSITEELEKLDWVKKANINLISNTATVQFIGKTNVGNIIEAIEDIGFEAALDNVVDSNALATSLRTVEFEIGGMFCSHCPDKILQSLGDFGDTLCIDRTPTLDAPILKISYVPQPPNLSIRSIMSILTSIDDRFDISIYHPPTLEERSRAMHAAEQRRILARVVLTVFTAIPTFIIGILLMSLVPSTNKARQYLEKPWTAGVSRAQWALFIMASPIYFFAADVFHRRAVKEVYHLWRKDSKTPVFRRFYRFGSMNMLMSLGTSIAYISSVAQLIVAGTQRTKSSDNNTFYFDSVVFLTMFLLIGRFIEAYSKLRTGDTISMLGKLRPTEALLMEENSQAYINGPRVNVDLLEVGDVVRVLNGASPPCDGKIVEGDTIFDESSLTGEVKPVKKGVGDEAFSGTVNKGAPVSLRMTGLAGNSLMDQIIKTVREGQIRRAPIEGIADSLTGYFVPFVTAIAICTWIIWLSLGVSGSLPSDYLGSNSQGWIPWSLQFAIAVFVVACPCGLALAAPTALFVGGGLAAQHGILVKGGGEALEKASRLDCIVFDKTGTLTHGGEPVVTDYEISTISEDVHCDWQEVKLLSAIKAIEEDSGHTLAKAIVSFCHSRELPESHAGHLEEIPGKGMKANMRRQDDGTEVTIIIGNEAMMSDHDVVISNATNAQLDIWKSQGKSVALVAMKASSGSSFWHLSAIFAISDSIRNEAPSVISKLRQRGIEVWMISGDNYATARAVGADLGIPASNIIAGVLPNEKAEKIQYLQKSLKSRNDSGKESMQKRALVAMVGDGINDAPALATADVGIAIGSGSDVAISSAEFVLVSSNLNTLITLLDLSKVVFSRIKFNFGWALVYNLVGVPVAAGVLYPIMSHGSHVRLDPVWASLAMALSSISVVCSSLALRSRIPGLGFRR